MLEILLGAVFFIIAVLFALPFFSSRRHAGVPGAQYREAAYGEQVEWLWRSFKHVFAVSAGSSDVTQTLRRLEGFQILMQCVVAEGFDEEIQPWIDDVMMREGAAVLSRLTMLWVLQLEHPSDREKQLLVWWQLYHAPTLLCGYGTSDERNDH